MQRFSNIQRYFLNFFCWADVGINVLFAGDWRETCSSRLGRYQDTVKSACIIAGMVDWVALKVFGQANHCKVSIQCEHVRAHEIWK